MAVGAAAWKLLYEISPILLVDGVVAKYLPVSVLPIILATEVINFPLGVLTSGRLPTIDEAFAHFAPLPGATVIDQQLAQYPFANMRVAVNATVEMPLHISMHMICPARGPLSYWSKFAKMTALIELLKWHNRLGGMYHVVTPSVLYTNCVMRNMRDVSSSQTKQVQNIWQIDFEKPLLTLEDANQWLTKLGNLIDKLGAGQVIVGQPQLASTAQTVAGSGIPPASGVLVPASVPSWPNGPI